MTGSLVLLWAVVSVLCYGLVAVSKLTHAPPHTHPNAPASSLTFYAISVGLSLWLIWRVY